MSMTHNSEGYADPTAYLGTQDVVKQESILDKKVHTMVHIIRDVAGVAGFEVVGRITFNKNRDKVGVKSETLSRHSVTYFDLDVNQVRGYPVSLLGFLESYKKARF